MLSKTGIFQHTLFVAKNEEERLQYGKLQPYWGKAITTEAHVNELTNQVGSWVADGRKLVSVERI